MSFLSTLFGKKRKKEDIPISQAPREPRTEISSQKSFSLPSGTPPTLPKEPVRRDTAVWEPGEKLLDRYEVRQIKEGGFGIVYLCFDHKYKMPVAAKTIKVPDSELLDKFYIEAETWVRLEKHKNIVQAKTVERIDGQPYIFLEFVAGHESFGPDLRTWMREKGQFSLEMCLNFGIQFCSGMEYATAKFEKMGQPFVHRDIKPANIMVTHDGVIKITDFGLVKTFEHKEGDIFEGAGTPAYMPPEQWGPDDEVDVRSDIYAFGCVLFETMAGRTPFLCGEAQNYEYHHRFELPPPLKDLAPEAGRGFNDVVMKCLLKDKTQRFRNFSDLKETLMELYRELTGREIPQETGAEMEAWERLQKGIALKSLGYRKDAVRDYVEAFRIDNTAVQRLLPSDLAMVRGSTSPETKVTRLIFLILSTPANYSNQKNISSILDILVSRYGVRFIGTEGGSGMIDLSFYRQLPNPKSRASTADYFLKEARISGAEHFAITTPEDIVFYGLEDQALFEANTEAFKQGITPKEQGLYHCAALETALTILKKHLYNYELTFFDETRDSLGEFSSDYLLFLNSVREIMGIQEALPNLSLHWKSLLLLKNVRKDTAEEELRSCLDKLQDTLEETRREGLTRAVLDRDREAITDYQFFTYFKELLGKYLPSNYLKDFPNLEAYMESIICDGKKDIVSLFDEVHLLENRIRTQLYTSQEQKILDEHLNDIKLLSKAYSMALRPTEQEAFDGRRAQMSAPVWINFIEQQAKKFNISVMQDGERAAPVSGNTNSIILPKGLEGALEALSGSDAFYDRARQRSIKLAENCIDFMEQETESAGIIVCCGFHSAAIENYLTAQAVPFVVVAPKYELTELDTERYTKAVLGKKTPIEEALGK